MQLKNLVRNRNKTIRVIPVKKVGVGASTMYQWTFSELFPNSFPRRINLGGNISPQGDWDTEANVEAWIDAVHIHYAGDIFITYEYGTVTGASGIIFTIQSPTNHPSGDMDVEYFSAGVWTALDVPPYWVYDGAVAGTLFGYQIDVKEPSVLLSAVSRSDGSVIPFGRFVATSNPNHDTLSLMLYNTFDGLSDYEIDMKCFHKGSIVLTFAGVTGDNYTHVVLMEFPHKD